MVAIIWQFLRGANLKAKIAALKFGKFAKLHLARTYNSIYAGAIALTLLTGFGIFLAYVGYKCEADWLVGTGQFLIALGGMAATGVLCLFYLKVGVLGTHSLHAIDGFMEFVSRGKIKNFFSKEVAANIRNDLLNAFAWVAAFCLWCDFVPVWKMPVAIPIGATMAAFFAFASARSWTFVEKPIGKAVVFIFLAVMFIANTANAFTAGAISDWFGERGELAGIAIRNDAAGSAGQREILDARREFVRETATAHLREYRRLAERQITLMSSEDRESEDVRREFAKNTGRMAELEGEASASKRSVRKTTAPVIVPAANPAPETSVSGSGDWFGSNWGWAFIAFLALTFSVLAVIGFATRQNHLASIAMGMLVIMALAGSVIWFAKSAGAGGTREVSSPTIPPAQIRLQVPLEMPRGITNANATEDSTRQNSHSEKSSSQPRRLSYDQELEEYSRMGIRQGLNKLLPERPGEWD